MIEKSVILENFNKSIKLLLTGNIDITSNLIEDSLVTYNICSSIEAIFLHGQNRKQSSKDFWLFLKVFLPKNLINIFDSHVKSITNIGYCRMWVRYSINENTLTSYIESMIYEQKALKKFYSKDAFIRDEEFTENFLGLYKSIVHLHFDLKWNISLNSWTNSDALKLIGCEVIPNFINPNVVNEDTSQTTAEENDFLSTSLYVQPSCIEPANEEYANELEKLLISKNEKTELYDSIKTYPSHSAANLNNLISSDELPNESSNNINPQIICQSNDQLDDDEYKIFTNNENANMKETEYSINKNENLHTEITNLTNNENIDTKETEYSINKNENLHTEEFKILTNNENLESDESNNVTADDKNSLEMTSQSNYTNQCSMDEIMINDIKNSENELFSFNSSFIDSIEPVSNTQRLMDIFPGVEKCYSMNGKNSVFGGLCNNCNSKLQLGKCFIDNYDGLIYCTGCEFKDKCIIPRDIINNWDFTLKPVSISTKSFLSEIALHPNINMEKNELMFKVIPDLRKIRKIRQKLNILWIQISSCDIEIANEMKLAIYPREHILGVLSEKDLYSLNDLIMVRSGHLEKVIVHILHKIAIPHVESCSNCKMKAKACDYCRDETKPIYLYNIEDYISCSSSMCQAVIHNRCKSSKSISVYCSRCIKFLNNQQPIILDTYDFCN